MKAEGEPITDDEWLIRLVWKTRHKPDRTPIITQSSFEPRENETTGISLFRQACLEDPLDVLKAIKEESRDGNALVRVSSTLIRAVGCTIQSDPIPQVSGHVLIPEINYSDYQADKVRLKAWFLRLAHEASANIIRPPQV